MRHSINTLLAWMRESPRTIAWNAIIAYDRNKTNTVLLQEYIERFSGESYLPPMDGTVDSTESELEWIYDFLLDAPRLSFETSNINASKAQLTMRILGGAQVSIATEPGRSAAVIRVASYDALQGPKFTMEIDLLDVQGTVDAAGKVQVDLGQGRGPRLYYAPTKNQREKGGKFMLNELNSLDPEIKVFVLNEMGSQDGQFLRPHFFELRTHAEPGAKVARAANFGEGEVLLFVTMDKEQNGTIPARDEDMQFLIPAGDFSSTIMMGQRFMLRRILAEGCRKMAEGGAFSYQLTGPAEGFAEGLDVTGGEYKGAAISTSLASFQSLTMNAIALPMANNFKLEMDQDNESLRVHWSGSRDYTSNVTPKAGTSQSGTIGLSWRFVQPFKFELVGEDGELKLTAISTGKVSQVKASPGSYVDKPDVANNFAEIAGYLEDRLTTELSDSLSHFASIVEEIDIFRLNSLLFRGSNIVHFKNAHAPGDLALFGELAPELTRFVVTPLEPLVGHGAQLQFKTEPVMQGLKWEVKNIEGEAGNPGSIGQDGLYKAPAKEQIQGFFTRVRVEASKDAYTSSALVTVLVRSIVINPFVQICGASIEGQPPVTREVAAGALNTGVLTWSVPGNTGSSVIPSTVEGGDHTFVARAKDPNETFTLDEILVKDSAGNSDYSWVLVVHKAPTGQIIIDRNSSAPEGQVQLLMDLGQGPIDPGEGPKYNLEWTLLKGGGHIDTVTGQYEADPASQYRFALIKAHIPAPLPGYPAFDAFIILPLPLLEMPTLLKALDTSDVYFKTAARLGAEEAAKVLVRNK